MPGFRKAKLSFLVLCAAALGTPSALAGPLDPYGYDIFDVAGPAFVMGTITTDGTFGILNPSNILAWNITVNDGTNSSTLTMTNSTLTILGSDLTATPTRLDFDFSAATPGYVDFNNAATDFPAKSFFDIFVDVSLPNFNGDSGVEWGVAYDSLPSYWDQEVAGIRAIGTTPLPAALPLLASGLSALGLFGWRKKRKYVANLAAV
jgi:hypothetical protein